MAACLAVLVPTGLAAEGYGRLGKPPSGECTDPGYLSMDPDISTVASYTFDVTIRRTNRVVVKHWTRIYPTRECCVKAWQPVKELVDWLPAGPSHTVAVGECK
jgi:hypothetical protein